MTVSKATPKNLASTTKANRAAVKAGLVAKRTKLGTLRSAWKRSARVIKPS